MDDGAFGVAGTGAVADVRVRPAELGIADALADHGGLVQGAVPVGVLLDDDHHEAVVEAHRAPDPVEALGPQLLGRPSAVLTGDRAYAPTAVAGAGPLPRRDGELLAGHADAAAAGARLDEPPAFEQQPVAAVLGVVRLPGGGKRRGPGQVVRQAVRVAGVCGAGQPQAGQRFLDGDGERADGEREAVIGERVGGPYGVQPVAEAEGGIGVDDTGVGVDTEAGDQQGAAGVVHDMEDAPVVGVAVAGGDMPHGQRDLVDRVLVERDRAVGHGLLLGARSAGRSPVRAPTAGVDGTSAPDGRPDPRNT